MIVDSQLRVVRMKLTCPVPRCTQLQWHWGEWHVLHSLQHSWLSNVGIKVDREVLLGLCNLQAPGADWKQILKIKNMSLIPVTWNRLENSPQRFEVYQSSPFSIPYSMMESSLSSADPRTQVCLGKQKSSWTRWWRHPCNHGSLSQHRRIQWPLRIQLRKHSCHLPEGKTAWQSD